MSALWIDEAADAAIDYACALGMGTLFGDWDAFDAAMNRFVSLAGALCPLAVASSSGADDELEFYGGAR